MSPDERVFSHHHGHEHVRCAACGAEFHSQRELDAHKKQAHG